MSEPLDKRQFHARNQIALTLTRTLNDLMPQIARKFSLTEKDAATQGARAAMMAGVMGTAKGLGYGPDDAISIYVKIADLLNSNRPGCDELEDG